MPTLAKKRLIIVARNKYGMHYDVNAIARELVRRAPHIAVTIASPKDTVKSLPADIWQLPTVTVALGIRLGRLTPPRGAIFQNHQYKKLEQFERFRSAGITTPRTGLFRPGQNFDETDWGEFVILKPLPLSLTSKGSSVKLFRARSLAKLDFAKLPASHALRLGPALVQEFIDTGLYPSKWRVLSLFGEPLYSAFSISMLPRANLSAEDDMIESSLIEPRTVERAGSVNLDSWLGEVSA